MATTIDKIAAELQEVTANIESAYKVRNVLISSGLDKEANAIYSQILPMQKKQAAIKREFEEMQNKSQELMFKMFFGIDYAYNQVMIFDEFWKNYAGGHYEVTTEVKKLITAFHSFISGIDEFGFSKLSEIYADATTEIDEQTEVLAIEVDKIFHKYKKRLLEAHRAGDRKKDQQEGNTKRKEQKKYEKRLQALSR